MCGRSRSLQLQEFKVRALYCSVLSEISLQLSSSSSRCIRTVLFCSVLFCSVLFCSVSILTVFCGGWREALCENCYFIDDPISHPRNELVAFFFLPLKQQSTNLYTRDGRREQQTATIEQQTRASERTEQNSRELQTKKANQKSRSLEGMGLSLPS